MTAEAHVAITTPLYDLELERLMDGEAACWRCGQGATHIAGHDKCWRFDCHTHAEFEARLLAAWAAQGITALTCSGCKRSDIDPADVTIRLI